MQVKFSKKFKKQFDKTNVKIQIAFDQRLRLFVENPNHPLLRNHQLAGKLQNYYSMNITGDWRAIYSLISSESGETCAQFEMLGTHSQLYR